MRSCMGGCGIRYFPPAAGALEGGHAVAVKRCSACASDAMVMLAKVSHDHVRMPLTIETGDDRHYYGRYTDSHRKQVECELA